jgi:3-deoxy-D-arabino-heptulosonate 7-phosphate (DAHP) synthase
MVSITNPNNTQVHPATDKALSDGDQSLTLDAFGDLMRRLAPSAEAAGRSVSTVAIGAAP